MTALEFHSWGSGGLFFKVVHQKFFLRTRAGNSALGIKQAMAKPVCRIKSYPAPNQVAAS
jgi:hypothetical protein